MKKRSSVLLAIVALAGLMAAFATTAQALPTYTTPCSGCHSGANVPVVATLVTTVGTTATYNVSAPGATAIAVFDGATKVGSPIIGTSGALSLAVGRTYTIFAIKGPTNSDGIGSTSVSPVAQPAADTVAPTTTSDAAPTYLNSATIHLTATDNAGGSGVAHTYYILDGAAQTVGTTAVVSSIGLHTVEFWSVDVAGNIETPHHTASFQVTAPVLDVTAPVTISNAQPTYVGSAAVKLTATDVGGAGVAHTYYALDGGARTEGTTIVTSALGTHAIEFWSVDGAGNVESPHGAATFLVTSAPAQTGYTVRVRISLDDHRTTSTLRAVLTNRATGVQYVGTLDARGVATFTGVPAGLYTFTVTGRRDSSRARIISVGLPHGDD